SSKNTRQPIRAAARRASWTISGRLADSLSTATVSPARRAQRASTASKAASQGASIVGAAMDVLRGSIIHEYSCNQIRDAAPQSAAAELLVAGVSRRAGHVRHRRD